MENNQTPIIDDQPVIYPQSMDDILKSYRTKDLRLPTDRVNPRSIDRFPDHVLGNYTVHNPEQFTIIFQNRTQNAMIVDVI